MRGRTPAPPRRPMPPLPSRPGPEPEEALLRRGEVWRVRRGVVGCGGVWRGGMRLGGVRRDAAGCGGVRRGVAERGRQRLGQQGRVWRGVASR